MTDEKIIYAVVKLRVVDGPVIHVLETTHVCYVKEDEISELKKNREVDKLHEIR